MKRNLLIGAAMLAVAFPAACKRDSKTDVRKVDSSEAASTGSSKTLGASPRSSQAPGGTSSTKRLTYPNSDDGLKQVLGELTKEGAKPRDVMAALTPDIADCEAAFEASAAKAIKEHSEGMLAGGGGSYSPADAIVIEASGTSEDFKAFKDGSDVHRGCPGGYRAVGSVMKPGNKFYCVKVGGKTLNLFAYVNGHWVLFPKVFRALKE